MGSRSPLLATLTLLGSLMVFGILSCDLQQRRAPGPVPTLLEPVDAATLDTLDGWGQRPARIVLIVIDTLRRDALNAYGGSANTPHIDTLAARSQVFKNAYGSYFQTSMSMGAMFTGRTPSLESGVVGKPLKFTSMTWCGMARFAGDNEGMCIPRKVPTLAQELSRQGYWTIAVTSNGLLFKPGYGLHRGFDDWVQIGDSVRRRGSITPQRWKQISEARSWTHVNDAAKNALVRRRSDNFFLYVHYMDVHDYRGYRPEYDAGLATVDLAIGDLMQRLRDAKLLEGTRIILTSDHGERISEQHFTEGASWHFGNPAFEETLRIPLLVSPPISDNDSQLMRTEDIFRLITELAGVETLAESELHADELYVSERDYQTYERGRWKSFRRRDNGFHVLIDLESDPLEMTNVADANPEVVAEHADRLAELAQQLAARDAQPAELSEDDKQKLRELGYLE